MSAAITREGFEPAVGVIGGSGLYAMEGLEEVVSRRVETPFGEPSDAVVEGRLGGRRVCFLPRHGVGHRILPMEINHRANIWALRSLGVRWVISVTAVGSLREEMAPRDMVVPDQLIDRTGTGGRHTFFGNGIAAHVGFAQPYSEGMRQVLLESACELAPKVHDGATFMTMNGPAFSTRAEAAMHRMMGADLIGMTNAPETRLCREAEIACAALALVTDYDCWKEEAAAVEVGEVIENLHANSSLAKAIVKAAVGRIPQEACWPEHRALEGAIMTPRELWPEETVKRLWPVLAGYLG
jgi:5'-methylthioadenosine phosphorylase